MAAKAVRVSPRTIRRYIDRGELEAKPQGEGVRREWLISVDSLHALRASRASRTIEGGVPDAVPDAGRDLEYADSIADVLREMSTRLESRAEEAAELRVRLELTERAQSTLEDERRRALEDLEEERRRRERAEREREELRRQLESLREEEEPPEAPGAYEASEAADEQQGRGQAQGQPPSGASGTQEAVRRPWWRRMFGSFGS